MSKHVHSAQAQAQAQSQPPAELLSTPVYEYVTVCFPELDEELRGAAVERGPSRHASATLAIPCTDHCQAPRSRSGNVNGSARPTGRNVAQPPDRHLAELAARPVAEPVVDPRDAYILRLVEMGFVFKDVQIALQRTDNGTNLDIQRAAEYLLTHTQVD